MSTRPILLVHGAWAGAWAWGFVAAELERHDITPHALDLPSRSDPGATLAADAAAVGEALDALDAPAVLLGHSYAGEVITQASAGNAKVAHLVYLCAILPQEGETTLGLMSTDPTPSSLGEAIVMREDGTSVLDLDGARRIAFNDCSDEQVEPILPLLGPHTMRVFGESASALGWKDHPSTYILTTNDKIFSPDLQRRMASSAGSVVKVDAGHIPHLRRAGEIADVLAGIATARS